MKNFYFILLIPVLILAFTVRLYKLDNPIADWHSWRQADTAAVSRNFVKDGLDPLYPRFNTMNSLNENFQPNPNRYFFAEFPLYNILHYYAFTLFNTFSLEEWGRLISIFAATLTTLVLYLLVKEYSSQRVAFISAFFYAFLPFNVYYGRVILPDPLHVFLGVLSLYLVTLWIKKDKWYLSIFAGLALSGALLTKPFGLILFIPIAYLFLSHWNKKLFLKKSLYLFLFISLVPLIFWRWHINQHPEGMFGTTWLYNSGNIRFTGAYFRWLIFDRMNRLIFATGGFVLFWMGVVQYHTKRESLFYFSWLLAIAVFFVIIAKGNVTHDYYQLPLVPIGCIFMAKGFEFLISSTHSLLQRGINSLIAIGLVLLMLSFGWYEVRGYFNINNPAIVTAGKWVDANLPKDATVIAPYQNDPAFLYQTNRVGWTFGGDKIETYKNEGADYLVSVNYDTETNLWMELCRVTEMNKDFVVVNLQECKETSVTN